MKIRVFVCVSTWMDCVRVHCTRSHELPYSARLEVTRTSSLELLEGLVRNPTSLFLNPSLSRKGTHRRHGGCLNVISAKHERS